jgi:hypothetical protein
MKGRDVLSPPNHLASLPLSIAGQIYLFLGLRAMERGPGGEVALICIFTLP